MPHNLFAHDFLDFMLVISWILGFVWSVENVYLVGRTHEDWKWLRRVFALMGFLWGVFYLVIWITPDNGIDAGAWGPLALRPLVIGTLLVLVAEGIFTIRSRKL